MNINNHLEILKDGDPYIQDLVQTKMDILDRIHFLIDKHFQGSQVELSKKMGISEARVSKMVNGLQNFTLSTLKKLEHAFGEHIIVVRCEDDHNDVHIDGFINTLNPTSMEIDLKRKILIRQKPNLVTPE